jgi:hypothetical protein
VSTSRGCRSFGNYGDFFKKEKALHMVTDDARAMEEGVANTHKRYAVRIEHCWRLFFNTAGDPIPAVNCVSLGAQEQTGETTLIKMITSMLPVSDGKIEILGRDVAVDLPTVQHSPLQRAHAGRALCDVLDPADAASETDLMNVLGLSFLRSGSSAAAPSESSLSRYRSSTKIILLNEPTASLDPVARHEALLKFPRPQRLLRVQRERRRRHLRDERLCCSADRGRPGGPQSGGTAHAPPSPADGFAQP